MTCPSPYVVNVSSVQDFMQCRYRWLCKWHLNRVPRKEGDALALGKVIHTIFEDHYRHGVPLLTAACEQRRLIDLALAGKVFPEWEAPTYEKVSESLADIQEAWPLWKDTYDFDVPVLEVEEPFTIEFPDLPGVQFRGRPDRVAVMNGNVWHVQNRGLAAQMNFGTYVRLAKRHFHEHLYAEHLAVKYADLGDYGGTIFNLVRKLKYRIYVGTKREKTRTAAEMFWQHPVSVNLNSLNHRAVMQDLFYHVSEMQRVINNYERTGMLPAPNDKMNGGYSGSAEDPYFKLLIGEIELRDDEWFKDREDTYAVADTGTD